MAKSDKRFLNGGWIAGSIAGQAIAALVVLNGLAQTFERQISQCIRLNVLPDFLHAVRRGDELLAGGRINPVKAGLDGRRTTDAHMDFLSARIPHNPHNFAAGGTANEGIIHQNHSLPG